MTFLGASGAVQVGVNYDNHYAFDGSVAPRPFTGASEADEHRLLSVISPPKLFLTKLTRVGGLRVVEVEYSQELPQGAPIAGDVREIEVASAWVGDSRSQVHLAVFCRTEHWAASRATFLAILETVSFSRPAGLG